MTMRRRLDLDYSRNTLRSPLRACVRACVRARAVYSSPPLSRARVETLQGCFSASTSARKDVKMYELNES